MILLERAIAAKEAAGDAVGAAWLRTISPVAWRHINFYGTFTFQEEPPAPPLEDCIAAVLRYRHRHQEPDVEQAMAEAA